MWPPPKTEVFLDTPSNRRAGLMHNLCSREAAWSAGRRMRASLRPYDEIGRYGGGLFLVVIPGSNSRNSYKQAQRLQLSISEQPIEIPQRGQLAPQQDIPVPITISVGVTIGTKEDDSDSVIRAAEEATERAKSAGANSIEQIESPHPAVSPGAAS